MWGVTVPFPLPAAGAKVRVIGRYARTFTRASSGIDVDRENGIITVTRVERATTPADRQSLCRKVRPIDAAVPRLVRLA